MALLPFDVDDPRLLPFCVDCVALGVDVLLHVELSVPGPHPDVGAAADELEVDVLHVELSVPGPHPDVDVDVDCGLLVVLHVELSVPGPHPKGLKNILQFARIDAHLSLETTLLLRRCPTWDILLLPSSHIIFRLLFRSE